MVNTELNTEHILNTSKNSCGKNRTVVPLGLNFERAQYGDRASHVRFFFIRDPSMISAVDP